VTVSRSLFFLFLKKRKRRTPQPETQFPACFRILERGGVEKAARLRVGNLYLATSRKKGDGKLSLASDIIEEKRERRRKEGFLCSEKKEKRKKMPRCASQHSFPFEKGEKKKGGKKSLRWSAHLLNHSPFLRKGEGEPTYSAREGEEVLGFAAAHLLLV